MSLRQTFQILMFRSPDHLEKWLRCRKASLQRSTIWWGQSLYNYSSYNSWSLLVGVCLPHLGLQLSKWSLLTLWVSGTVTMGCFLYFLAPGSWNLTIWSKGSLISPRGRIITKQLALLHFLRAYLGLPLIVSGQRCLPNKRYPCTCEALLKSDCPSRQCGGEDSF